MHFSCILDQSWKYSQKVKKKLVIKLYKDEKTYKEIAKMVRISPRDIGKIINEYTGEDNLLY